MEPTTETFAQEMGKPAFDWNAFLAVGRRRSDLDWRDAGRLAGSWITCACGNQCAVLPRYIGGKPFDPELATLGIDFSDAVDDKNARLARLTLAAIEKRTSELLAAL